jgi:hypothetical protein
MNRDNMDNIRREATRTFGTKTENIRKTKSLSLKQIVRPVQKD